MAKKPQPQEEVQLDEVETATSGGGKKKLILLLIIVLLLLLIGAAAAYFLLLAGDDKPASAQGDAAPVQGVAPIVLPKPIFHDLKPRFIVNLASGDAKMLQLELAVMAHDQAVLDSVQGNDPRLRNNLLELLAQQDFATLITNEGKEALRQQVLDEINRILAAANAPGAVQGVYITDLKMQ